MSAQATASRVGGSDFSVDFGNTVAVQVKREDGTLHSAVVHIDGREVGDAYVSAKDMAAVCRRIGALPLTAGYNAPSAIGAWVGTPGFREVVARIVDAAGRADLADQVRAATVSATDAPPAPAREVPDAKVPTLDVGGRYPRSLTGIIEVAAHINAAVAACSSGARALTDAAHGALTTFAAGLPKPASSWVRGACRGMEAATPEAADDLLMDARNMALYAVRGEGERLGLSDTEVKEAQRLSFVLADAIVENGFCDRPVFHNEAPQKTERDVSRSVRAFAASLLTPSEPTRAVAVGM